MKQLSLFPGKETQQTELSAALATYWTLTTDQLLSELHTTYNGIQQVEAESRIKQYGPNPLKVQQQTTVFGLLLSQFKSPLILILIFASIVSAFVGEWTDAIIILAIVIGSTMLGFVQEYRASNAVEKLCSQVTIKSNVLHGGKPQLVPSEQVVPGDVVLLSAGSLIPTDGIVPEASDFFVNQAVLTGETFPIEKTPGIVTAMVGLLQTPIGTRLYDRLKREGCLRGIMSGDNVDGTTNIIPSMNTDVLYKGYKNVFS